MAVATAPHRPAPPREQPPCATRSLGLAVGPRMAPSHCDRRGGRLVGHWPPGPGSLHPALLQPWGAPAAAALPRKCESCCGQCKCTSSCLGSSPGVFQLRRPLRTRGDPGPARPLSRQTARLGVLAPHSAPLCHQG